MTKSMKRIHTNGKRITRVALQQVYDQDADASYLEQEGFEDRLAEYKADQFSFLGIRAKAEIVIPSGPQLGTVQFISSGGLWGVESDSANSYLVEIEQEQLAELRDQLHAIGFSQRAISAAFKNVEHEGV